MNLGAVILAGGESSRMGRDKAWVTVAGQPLMVRANRAIREAGVCEVYISGHGGRDYSSLGCPVLVDREPGFGPLAGMDRALEEVRAPLLLVLAVDLPRLDAEFIRLLAAQCDPLTGAIPRVRGQLEPLAAIYPKRCRYLARDCLLRRQLAAREFANACLRERAVKAFPVGRRHVRCFDNCNTPADLAAVGIGAGAGEYP